MTPERHQRSANGHRSARRGLSERPPEVCPIFSRSSRLPSRHARNKLRYPAVTLPSPVVHFDSSTRSEPGGRFVGCTGALRSAGLETPGRSGQSSHSHPQNSAPTHPSASSLRSANSSRLTEPHHHSFPKNKTAPSFPGAVRKICLEPPLISGNKARRSTAR